MLYSKLSIRSGISTKRLSKLFFAALLGFFSMSLAYSTISSANDVLLTIHGNMEGAGTEVLQLDIETLSALEPTSFTTTAPWLKEPTEFKGVRVNTLLESLGLKSTSFEAIAINDYSFILNEIDFDKYPIIIAYERNGQQLNVRSLGPLLIVFPFDDYPELLTERNKAASVWQLIEMRIL